MSKPEKLSKLLEELLNTTKQKMDNNKHSCAQQSGWNDPAIRTLSGQDYINSDFHLSDVNYTFPEAQLPKLNKKELNLFKSRLANLTQNLMLDLLDVGRGQQINPVLLSNIANVTAIIAYNEKWKIGSAMKKDLEFIEKSQDVLSAEILKFNVLRYVDEKFRLVNLVEKHNFDKAYQNLVEKVANFYNLDKDNAEARVSLYSGITNKTMTKH